MVYGWLKGNVHKVLTLRQKESKSQMPKPQRIPHRMWEDEPKYQVLMTIKMGIYSRLPFFKPLLLPGTLWR